MLSKTDRVINIIANEVIISNRRFPQFWLLLGWLNAIFVPLDLFSGRWQQMLADMVIGMLIFASIGISRKEISGMPKSGLGNP